MVQIKTYKTRCPTCGKIGSYTGRLDRRKDKKHTWACGGCSNLDTTIRLINYYRFNQLFENMKVVRPDLERPDDLANVLTMIEDFSDEEIDLVLG